MAHPVGRWGRVPHAAPGGVGDSFQILYETSQERPRPPRGDLRPFPHVRGQGSGTRPDRTMSGNADWLPGLGPDARLTGPSTGHISASADPPQDTPFTKPPGGRRVTRF